MWKRAVTAFCFHNSTHSHICLHSHAAGRHSVFLVHSPLSLHVEPSRGFAASAAIFLHSLHYLCLIDLVRGLLGLHVQYIAFHETELRMECVVSDSSHGWVRLSQKETHHNWPSSFVTQYNEQRDTVCFHLISSCWRGEHLQARAETLSHPPRQVHQSTKR